MVAGNTLNADGLPHNEPDVFLLLLMGLSVVWMMWYLLWTRRRPGASPHKDHHAGGFSLLLCVFLMVYNCMMAKCQSLPKVLLPFFQTPFLILQTYLLWAHSKDCFHKHRVLTRFGLMLTLSTDVLLWINAVTEDSIHMEIEIERQYNETIRHVKLGTLNLLHQGQKVLINYLEQQL
ncbi:proton channel OTOP2-like [Clarias gariepinus]